MNLHFHELPLVTTDFWEHCRKEYRELGWIWPVQEMTSVLRATDFNLLSLKKIKWGLLVPGFIKAIIGIIAENRTHASRLD